MAKLPPEPPLVGRIIVATLATFIGAYVAYDFGKDFEFVKFTPHSKEEIERRKRENIPLKMKSLDTMTLELKPEVKERMRALKEQESKEEK
ncbi:hypothetical protein CLIB1444_05S06590 [[Candida] jaroonii]|uniref:Uncharacterized protein n=1 Tax=[Candida] jaroonii TaxID=467808 RepID=A0ACA9Y890_9ASCO|nr:hypothetical protein CLIB1444_05S06590 [[Candida] jaroonii]